jgi:hypothetical protein
MATVMHGSVPGVYEVKNATQVSSEKKSFCSFAKVVVN